MDLPTFSFLVCDILAYHGASPKRYGENTNAICEPAAVLGIKSVTGRQALAGTAHPELYHWTCFIANGVTKRCHRSEAMLLYQVSVDLRGTTSVSPNKAKQCDAALL